MIRYYCPECHAPIEVDAPKAGRAFDCPVCERTTLVPSPDDPPVATINKSSKSRLFSEPMTSFWWGLFVVFVGIIRGLMQAFDPDPEMKRRAGYSFAGVVAGMVVWPVLGWVLCCGVWLVAMGSVDSYWNQVNSILR